MKLHRQCAAVRVMALGAIASFGVVGAANASDTTLIREFAKNKPRVFIVASGPQATALGMTIKTAILHHPDNKHSAQDILVLSFADAVTASKQQPDFGKSPVIILMDRQEMDAPMPAELGYLLPKSSLGTGYNSNVSAVLGGVRDQQVFTVAMGAPNADRLGRLFDIFSAHTAAGFRDLPFSENWATNKLNVFSDHTNRELAENWGVVKSANVWNDIVWHDLAEYPSVPPGALTEGSSVFFIDRSQNDTAPVPAANLLSTHKPTPTMVAMERTDEDGQGNNGVIVFSAPNTTILERKAIHYATRDSVPVGDMVTDAVDMRKLGSTTILLSGDVPEHDRQPIRFMFASHMRKDLSLNVWERGHGLNGFQRDISLDQVEGQGDVARSLRAAGVRYAWHLSVNHFTGRTDYDSSVARVTPLPAPFDETEPTEPARRDLFGHKMSDDDYAKAMDKYHHDHKQWRHHKEDYDATVQTAIYNWRQTISAKQTAHIRGTLRLVDLRDPNSGHVIWEQECEGNGDAGSDFQTKIVAVQGPSIIPPALPAPPPVDEPNDDVMRIALENAGSQVFDDIMETALLPGLTADAMPADDNTTPDPTPITTAPVAKSGQVAEIQNGTITVTIGTAQGLQAGDHIRVVLSKRDIHDPNTGAVIDTRILDSVALKIVQLGKTTDCVPATAADTTKLSKVKIGMPVVIDAR